MKRYAVLGASGFVGGELLRLLAPHRNLVLARLFGYASEGARVEQCHPHLARFYAGACFERYRESALDGIDLVFCALPHGESQDIAADILARGIALVDIGADFRLRDPGSYAHWYGEAHRAPELLSQFVYGIPELHRDAIRASRAVAAAGCYPTAAILALKPLVDAGLVDTSSIVVDAISGVSGAGKALKESSHFDNVSGSLSAYGLFSHRHTAEMEASLGATVLFTPHLAPIDRGILATCYAMAAGPMAADAPLDALHAAYASERFVHVSDRPPSTKWTLGSNAVHLTGRYDPRTGRVLAIAALDNLVKGAAGQMIQCANLMLGFDEGEALPVCGVHP